MASNSLKPAHLYPRDDPPQPANVEITVTIGSDKKDIH